MTERLDNSGGAVWLYALGEAWSGLGATLTVYHFVGSTAEAQIVPPSSITVRGGVPAGRRFRHSLPVVVARTWRVVRSHDVVLVPAHGPAVIIGLLFARLGRRPIVAFSQGLAADSLDLYVNNRALRALYRASLRSMDACFGISPRSVASLRTLGVKPERLTEVRTAIDITRVRARAGVPDSVTSGKHTGRPLLIAVGRLHETKRFDRVIEAAAELRATGEDFHLLIVGPDAGAGPSLRALAERRGVATQVDLIGFVSNPVQLIASADVLVHAADYEPVGLVLLEALAVGTAVIAHDSPAGGPRLVLGGGEFGHLVDTTSPGALAAAIREHLRHPTLLRQKAQGSESHLRRSFSVIPAAQAAMSVFQRLSGSSG